MKSVLLVRASTHCLFLNENNGPCTQIERYRRRLSIVGESDILEALEIEFHCHWFHSFFLWIVKMSAKYWKTTSWPNTGVILTVLRRFIHFPTHFLRSHCTLESFCFVHRNFVWVWKVLAFSAVWLFHFTAALLFRYSTKNTRVSSRILFGVHVPSKKKNEIIPQIMTMSSQIYRSACRKRSRHHWKWKWECLFKEVFFSFLWREKISAVSLPWSAQWILWRHSADRYIVHSRQTNNKSRWYFTCIHPYLNSA